MKSLIVINICLGTPPHGVCLDNMGCSEAISIMVVEDEAIIRMLAADVLTDCGYVVYEAGCAEEALALIGEHPGLAVLFTDINMPGAMDGLALASTVHAMKPDVGLIVTSGGWLPDDTVPDDGVFLSKPYRSGELIEMVENRIAARAA